MGFRDDEEVIWNVVASAVTEDARWSLWEICVVDHQLYLFVFFVDLPNRPYLTAQNIILKGLQLRMYIFLSLKWQLNGINIQKRFKESTLIKHINLYNLNLALILNCILFLAIIQPTLRNSCDDSLVLFKFGFEHVNEKIGGLLALVLGFDVSLVFFAPYEVLASAASVV